MTGGNRGIGVHVVDKLLNCKMTVIVAVRNPDRAKEEMSRVINLCKFENQFHLESLDMSVQSSIRQFAERVSSKFSKIDILIHNGEWDETKFNPQECPFINSLSISFSWNNGVSLQEDSRWIRESNGNKLLRPSSPHPPPDATTPSSWNGGDEIESHLGVQCLALWWAGSFPRLSFKARI